MMQFALAFCSSAKSINAVSLIAIVEIYKYNHQN